MNKFKFDVFLMKNKNNKMDSNKFTRIYKSPHFPLSGKFGQEDSTLLVHLLINSYGNSSLCCLIV